MDDWTFDEKLQSRTAAIAWLKKYSHNLTSRAMSSYLVFCRDPMDWIALSCRKTEKPKTKVAIVRVFRLAKEQKPSSRTKESGVRAHRELRTLAALAEAQAWASGLLTDKFEASEWE